MLHLRLQALLDQPARAPLHHEIGEGLAFIAGHRLLRAITGCTATSNLFAAAAQPLLIVLLARDLQLSAGRSAASFPRPPAAASSAHSPRDRSPNGSAKTR